MYLDCILMCPVLPFDRNPPLVSSNPGFCRPPREPLTQNPNPGARTTIADNLAVETLIETHCTA